jgi:hypothetical protein
MSRKNILAVVIALIAALMLSGIAYAITIQVDGNRESAWDGFGGQTPGKATDGDEGGINQNVDMKTFQWTNDGEYFYFLIDVWGPPPLMADTAPIDICLDSDKLTSTTIYTAGYGTTYRDRCLYVEGIDTVIEAAMDTFGNKTVYAFDVTGSSKVPIGGGTLGYDTSAITPVVEISFPIANLGWWSCPTDIPTVVYYDGGDTNPDDNLPNSGALLINCGTPTTVKLDSLQAQPTTSPVVPVVLIGVSAVALIGVVFFTRRSRRKTA